MRILSWSLLVLASTYSAAGSQLILPAPALERDSIMIAVYKTSGQVSGKGELKIHWTDAYDRVVDDRSIPVELTDESEIRFPVDVRLAVAMQNRLQAHLSLAGRNKKGEQDQRDEDAEVNFIAKPADRSWWDYYNIMWQDGSAAHMRQLQAVGVNAGKSSESSIALPHNLLSDDMRWYVENMATDFYSEYHRYRKDRPYNFALLEAKELYKQHPDSYEGLKRHPSFSDPARLDEVRDRLLDAARVYSPYRPIFYNLADESGIAELAGFWDFDFSDHSLDAMRLWLRNRYGSLAVLNRQWGSSFSSWDVVVPETTRQAMRRTDENYSSWADHKEWMDVAFASALKVGVDAIHSVDAQAYVGIEGAQMPGWGGYDYARLSNTLDAMEPYDIGDNVEIIRSLNSKLAFVTTSFAMGPWEKHRTWYELLHGSRGNIIWDERNDVVSPDGTPGARGKDVAAYWKELRDGMGALIINSAQQSAPVAIHYSQASMRTEWMLAQRSKGDAWMTRLSSTERHDNDFLELRNSYCRLLEDEGLQYKFVAYNQVESGELMNGGYRILILPRSSALSYVEADAITRFVKQGGVLIVDGEPGTFDEHSRRLSESALHSILKGDWGRGKVVRMSALEYNHQRIAGAEAALHDAMAGILKQAGVAPHFQVVDGSGRSAVGVELHEYQNGGATILALDNNPPIEVDELGPLKVQSQKRFEKTQNVRLILPESLYAYNVRERKSLGKVKQLALAIDPYEPTILSFTPDAIPELRISAPEHAARGDVAEVGLSFMGASTAAQHVFHVDVFDPGGQLIGYYSGNILSPSGSAVKVLPFAHNAAAGKWSITARDLLSGQEKTTTFMLN